MALWCRSLVGNERGKQYKQGVLSSLGPGPLARVHARPRLFPWGWSGRGRWAARARAVVPTPTTGHTSGTHGIYESDLTHIS